MPNTNGMLQFKYGLQQKYNDLESKDLNTVYFTTDTQRMFVGETEYTRPVQHGSAVPESFSPPNSFFVKENGAERELHYSKDGTSWDLVAILPNSIQGGVFGENTAGTLASGGTIKVPKVTVGTRGQITAIEEVALKLPDMAQDTPETVTTAGDGNAITSAEFDEAGNVLTVTKGETFATKAELDAEAQTARAAEQEALQAGQTAKSELDGYKSTNDAAVQKVQQGLNKETQDRTQADTALGARIDELKGQIGDLTGAMHFVGESTADPAGESGPAVESVSSFKKGDVVLFGQKEYVYDGKKWIELGDEGSHATKSYVESKFEEAKKAGTDAASEAQKAQQAAATAQSGADAAKQAAESAKSAAEANKADITKITNGTTKVGKAGQADTATSSTKATQDGQGRNIADTYATKQEVTSAKLTWGAIG